MTTALLLSIRDQLADVVADLQAKVRPVVIEDPEEIKRRARHIRDAGHLFLNTFADDADFSRWDVMPVKVEYWPDLFPLARHLKRLDQYIAATQKPSA